jgi:hypothetical protein
VKSDIFTFYIAMRPIGVSEGPIRLIYVLFDGKFLQIAKVPDGHLTLGSDFNA